VFGDWVLLLDARGALLDEQVLPRLDIGCLPQSNLVVECLTIHVRKVEMAQPMTADPEVGIGNQLLGRGAIHSRS
jgi:hypothetical protein